MLDPGNTGVGKESNSLDLGMLLVHPFRVKYTSPPACYSLGTMRPIYDPMSSLCRLSSTNNLFYSLTPAQ